MWKIAFDLFLVSTKAGGSEEGGKVLGRRPGVCGKSEA